ncbi:uncharacterized protein C8orf76 homolog isoform X2 [Tiliqua scincoides]|uniref:uncharacterized protein C8orf76 homolog isoform X2 n=1 Tax=Tiliqua scincoides TaxID=71010 RepID=UPI0034635DEB
MSGEDWWRGEICPYFMCHLIIKWFCEEAVSEDDAESVNMKKFRGDLAYKQQEFKKALFEYSDCLMLLAPSNIAMRRDIQESRARCLVHLGRHQEALEIAEMLRSGATNTDHVTVVLSLQLAIYRTLEHIEKMIECLQKLILLHPFHPENWKLLAEAYVSRLRLPASLSVLAADFQGSESLNINNHLQVSSSKVGFQHQKNHSWRKEISLHHSSKATDSFGPCEECQTVARPISPIDKLEVQEESEDSWIYACASFIRARLLLQLVQSQQSSFALESNLKAQQDIEDIVASFGLKGDVLFLMTEAMGEDLVPANLKEDAQGEVKCLSASALTALMTAPETEFERKWFQKLRDNLSLLQSST